MLSDTSKRQAEHAGLSTRVQNSYEGLLAMNLGKLENGHALQGKPFLVHAIARALGMENATTSLIPESISEKPQDDENDPVTPIDARIFTTCVSKAMYLSHHRPDIQHSMYTLHKSLKVRR